MRHWSGIQRNRLGMWAPSGQSAQIKFIVGPARLGGTAALRVKKGSLIRGRSSMKQGLAALAVIVVIAAVGFGGFWIGRAGAPTASAGNEIAVSPTVAQSTSSVS